MTPGACDLCGAEPCRGQYLGCEEPHPSTNPAYRRPAISVDAVIRATCAHYGLRKSEMMSPRRDRRYLDPRSIAIYLCRVYAKISYPELGRAFGSRHHTTMIASFEKVHRDMGQGGRLRDHVVAIEAVLLGSGPRPRGRVPD